MATMKQLRLKYKNKFIICLPNLYDEQSGRPRTFKFLQTCRHTEDLDRILKYYARAGEYYEGAIAIPNFAPDLENKPDFPPEYCAKMFNILLGIQ